MARKLSDWQRHVKKVLRAGGTLKQAARSYPYKKRGSSGSSRRSSSRRTSGSKRRTVRRGGWGRSQRRGFTAPLSTFGHNISTQLFGRKRRGGWSKGRKRAKVSPERKIAMAHRQLQQLAIRLDKAKAHVAARRAREAAKKAAKEASKAARAGAFTPFGSNKEYAQRAAYNAERAAKAAEAAVAAAKASAAKATSSSSSPSSGGYASYQEQGNFWERMGLDQSRRRKKGKRGKRGGKKARASYRRSGAKRTTRRSSARSNPWLKFVRSHRGSGKSMKALSRLYKKTSAYKKSKKRTSRDMGDSGFWF